MSALRRAQEAADAAAAASADLERAISRNMDGPTERRAPVAFSQAGTPIYTQDGDSSSDEEDSARGGEDQGPPRQVRRTPQGRKQQQLQTESQRRLLRLIIEQRKRLEQMSQLEEEADKRNPTASEVSRDRG